MTKKLVCLAAALMLCLTCFASVRAEEAPATDAPAALPTLEEIYAANNFDSWNALYTMRVCLDVYYDANSMMTDVARELTLSTPSGSFASLYADTDHKIGFFIRNAVYTMNEDERYVQFYLKEQLPQMIENAKETPLVYTDKEIILSEDIGADGDIVINSHMAAADFEGQLDDTIDLAKYDTIHFITTVDGETLLFKSYQVFGEKDDDIAILCESDFIYSNDDPGEHLPGFVYPLMQGDAMRTITVVKESGEKETFEIPQGIDASVYCPEGYDVYADKDYTVITNTDLTKDITVYYLPDKK